MLYYIFLFLDVLSFKFYFIYICLDLLFYSFILDYLHFLCGAPLWSSVKTNNIIFCKNSRDMSVCLCVRAWVCACVCAVSTAEPFLPPHGCEKLQAGGTMFSSLH